MSVDFADVKRTARDRVLSLLWDLEWHGFEELHRVGGVRYSARLLELRRLGYEIQTMGKREAGLSYRLVDQEPGVPQAKRVKVFLVEEDAKRLLAIMNGHPDWQDVANALASAVGSFDSNRDKL